MQIHAEADKALIIINPRRACAGGWVCVCVCACVCVCVSVSVSVKSHLTPGASVLQRRKKFVGFSLKPLHCGDQALPPWKVICMDAIFTAEAHMRILIFARALHFPAESTHANICARYAQTCLFLSHVHGGAGGSAL